MAVLTVLFLAACFLAYSNGANDNFKGVATLFGSRIASYKRAIWWGTLATFAGAVSSFAVGASLAERFSGKGLVSDAVAGSPDFILAVALAAGVTVMVATLAGLPISTTHSLTGALAGSGLVAVGSRGMHFVVLEKAFLLPLLLSPFIAASLTSACAVRFPRGFRYGISDADDGATRRIAGSVGRANTQKAFDMAHYLSAGIVSFARGLNDAPKIAGLLLPISILGIQHGAITVALGMAAGGLLSAKKVAETVSERITPINHEQGFKANVVTGGIVLMASLLGMPISTTHVAVGSIFGIGFVRHEADSRMLLQILSAWILTLPLAAILGAGIYWIFHI